MQATESSLRPIEASLEVARVARVKAVPTMLQVVCRAAGMGFSAVARVTQDRWIACSVLDNIDFGLKASEELRVETTICHEIRQSRQAVAIDDVLADAAWCGHPTPAMYGFRSYISVPIILADGSLFGTLCAIDPKPARVNNPEVIGMFELFADLIAKHLDADQKLSQTESALTEELATAALREQFIAMLAHDLLTPMRSITSFSQVLIRSKLEEDARQKATLIRDSALRMNGLIENMLDLARGQLAGGLTIVRGDAPLGEMLQTVLNEQRMNHPDRVIESEISLSDLKHCCDAGRIAQVLSNLLSNAQEYGAPEKPVRVVITNDENAFEISVANAGKTISPDVLPHLFEPFFRSGGVRHREGLGLGLYISSEIAKAHGGTLEVFSQDGKTVFTLRVPIHT